MMFSWLRGLWSRPNSVTEDLDSEAPKAKASRPLRNLLWKKEAKLKAAELEAWEQKAIGQEKVEQKKWVRKQIRKTSCDLTIVRGGKCQRCQNLDANDFGPYASSGLSYHNFYELTTAARNGCKLCRVLFAGLGGEAEGRSEMQLERSRGLLSLSYRYEKPKHGGSKSVILEGIISEGTR
jgi:hypothetical protein